MGAARIAAAALVGYLVGTAPCASTAARLATGGRVDLRRDGSGNPGAANAIALLGPRWGYGVLAADVAKGAVASALGRSIVADIGAHVAGTAAVAGHCFPAWSGFRGGKGGATSWGQCLATFPAYFPLDLTVAGVAMTTRWRHRAFLATALASGAWVTSGVVWWRRGWPNAWGPKPTMALPVAATVSSGMILWRFAAARRGGPA